MKTRNFLLILTLNLSFLIAYSQNNDSLVTSIIDTTQSGYIIEFDTAEVTIKVTEVESGKETLITKEDKIIVYINGGKTKSGRWEIIDENNIKVKQVTVPISVIEKIKKQMSKKGKNAIGISVFFVVVAGAVLILLYATAML